LALPSRVWFYGLKHLASFNITGLDLSMTGLYNVLEKCSHLEERKACTSLEARLLCVLCTECSADAAATFDRLRETLPSYSEVVNAFTRALLTGSDTLTTATHSQIAQH